MGFLHSLETWPSSEHWEQVGLFFRHLFLVCPTHWRIKQRESVAIKRSIGSIRQLVILTTVGRLICQRWLYICEFQSADCFSWFSCALHLLFCGQPVLLSALLLSSWTLLYWSLFLCLNWGLHVLSLKLPRFLVSLFALLFFLWFSDCTSVRNVSLFCFLIFFEVLMFSSTECFYRQVPCVSSCCPKYSLFLSLVPNKNQLHKVTTINIEGKTLNHQWRGNIEENNLGKF